MDSAKGETVVLAFDTGRGRLVELHVIVLAEDMEADKRRSVLDRIDQAKLLRGLSFMKILDIGEEEGAVYYTTNLNNGEPVNDYMARRGALPAAAALCLMQQYLDDLVSASRFGTLVSRMHVDTPLVSTQEDQFLQLRIVDFGFAEPADQQSLSVRWRLATECCRLLFLLLTGEEHVGQNPERFPILSNLAFNLRTALIDPENAPSSLERLREDVREAYATHVTNLQLRSSRRHLILNDSLQPESRISKALLDGDPAAGFLADRFRLVHADSVRCTPFSLPAIQVNNGQAVTLHLLPPAHIVSKELYEVTPPQTWRCNNDNLPNILGPLSHWETPEWTFITEKREPGFSLNRLLAERSVLNPSEVAILLQQVRAGLDQARDCGAIRVDLHPANIVLNVGREGATLAREHERLMQKRIDVWPPFTLKIRIHATMRALQEPKLVESSVDAREPSDSVTEKEFRSRSFAALAVFLLTGERYAATTEFGEAVPDSLCNYLRDVMEAGENTPPPAEFLAEFKTRMAPSPGVEYQAGGTPEVMAGIPAVGNDEGATTSEARHYSRPNPTTTLQPSKKNLRTPLGINPLPAHRELPRGLAGMLLWAVGAMLLLGLAYHVVRDTNKAEASTIVQSTSEEKTTAVPVPASSPPTTPPEEVVLRALPSQEPGQENVTGAAAEPHPQGTEIIKKAIVPIMTPEKVPSTSAQAAVPRIGKDS